MRMVNRHLRDVKLPRLIHSSRQLHRAPCPLHHPLPRPVCPVRQDSAILRLSRTLATNSEAHLELAAPDDIPRSLQTPKSRRELHETIRPAASFGKWQWLAHNVQRLAIETDFGRKGPAKRWRNNLLVDQLENHGDFELWSCLLNYLQRTQGDAGALKLWNAMWGRKSLHEITSLPHKAFWQAILEATLRSGNGKFLDGILVYAEWMSEIHKTEWPGLYKTIVSHMLRTHQHEKAVQWHMRLTPNFYPGSHDFKGILHKFATDSILYSSFTLQSLYIASPERQVYDALVPYLYSRGQSQLARIWRHLCVKYDDVPLLRVPARPFLRYLRAYNSQITLHPAEVLAVGEPGSVASEGEEQLEVSREFVNRIHGRTFGFSAKTYNDQLGARWFATSWVSLDTAISAIAALGIQEIGPLSLQSISLREGTPDGILARIAQLRDMGIAIPNSGYVNTIQHFARVGDDVLLADILECDLHPDVFDDIPLQSTLMESSAESGDWRTYTLLLTTRLAFSEKSMWNAANVLLPLYLSRKDYPGVLRILGDMHAMRVGLDDNHAGLIFRYVMKTLKWHTDEDMPLENLDICLALCRRLSSMDVPVPIRCWEKICYCLGRHGCVDELLQLSLELIDYYTTRRSPRPGFMPIHLKDVPESLVKPLEGVENLTGLYIPLDVPTAWPRHPLNQLFDEKLQGNLIRWSFRRIHFPKESISLIGQGMAAQTLATHFGRAINVLRKLNDLGLVVNLIKVRRAVQLRLAELYGEAPPVKDTEKAARRTNILSLGQMKTLCDEAWGGELLPHIDELRVQIGRIDAKRWEYFREYLELLNGEKQSKKGLRGQWSERNRYI